jgi:serine/threonine-protein kinase HipA
VAALCVWMNGQRVGTWTPGKSAASEFVYEPVWIRSDYFRVLSLSIPVTADLTVRGNQVTSYFDNLLPDNPAIRKRIGERFKVRAETFELLTAIGRDCIGAVQLLPPAMEPSGWNEVQANPLTDAEVALHLRAVTAPASGIGARNDVDDFRISLAGAQEKSALLRMSGRWFRPFGATPTTHIVKLPLGVIAGGLDFKFSVENEWLCAQFLEAMDMPVANTDIETFEDQTVLVVERFDRRWIGANAAEIDKRRFSPGKDVYIARLPQEDFCQALGVPLERKYEKDGGPSIAQGLQLLAGSERAAADRSHFVLTQLLFWLLAAPDGHAKNFSIQHAVDGRYHLTPLYDVLSAWPLIGKKAKQLQYEKVSLAMSLRSKNAHYRLGFIQARHWHTLARSVGVDGLWVRMIATVERAGEVFYSLQKRLPSTFPEPVFNAIGKGIERHAKNFLDNLKHLEV